MVARSQQVRPDECKMNRRRGLQRAATSRGLAGGCIRFAQTHDRAPSAKAFAGPPVTTAGCQAPRSMVQICTAYPQATGNGAGWPLKQVKGRRSLLLMSSWTSLYSNPRLEAVSALAPLFMPTRLYDRRQLGLDEMKSADLKARALQFRWLLPSSSSSTRSTSASSSAFSILRISAGSVRLTTVRRA